MKSVCRLMPIYQELPVEQNKEQKIDDIRRKLKALHQLRKSLNINNENLDIQRQPLRKERLPNSFRAKLHPQISRGLLQLFNKDGGNERPPQTKDNRAIPQLRKTKTESSELNRDKHQKHVPNEDKFYPKSRIQLLIGQPEALIHRKYSRNPSLIIRSQEQFCNKTLFRNFRVNEQLRNLRKFNKNSIEHDGIIESKSNMQEQQLVRKQAKRQGLGNVDRQKMQKIECKSFSLKENYEKPKKKISISITKNKLNPSATRPAEASPGAKLNLCLSHTKSLNNSREFAEFVRLMNGVWAVCNQVGFVGRFYVGQGNNGELVKKLFRKRGLIQTHKIKDANIIWTQKRDYKLMDSMTSLENECVSEKYMKKINSYKWRCECANNNKKNRCTYWKLSNSKSLGSHQTLISIRLGTEVKILPSGPQIKTHNHLLHHEQICYKKNLFLNLKHYYEAAQKDPFSYLPLTFHIESVSDNRQWESFVAQYEKGENSWIIKPGENTNRGHGITVEGQLKRIKKVVDELITSKSSAIVQKYIMPLLYRGRKFDVRCYALATVVNDFFNVYWYEEGYVRTACKAFDMRDNSRYIHLTNDAVQKCSADYGKYEVSNKLSFEVLAEYLKQNCGVDFFASLYPQMVSLCHDAFDSTWSKLHQAGKDYCYEIFGLDFMIDDHNKVWLIEVNRNPCIETASLLLKNIITNMLDNAFMIANDLFFLKTKSPEAASYKVETKFNLLFQKRLSEI